MNQLRARIAIAFSQATCVGLLLSASPAVAAHAAADGAGGTSDDDEWSGEITVTLAPEAGIAAGDEALEVYAARAGWRTAITFTNGGEPDALRLFLPSPFSEAGVSARTATSIGSRVASVSLGSTRSRLPVRDTGGPTLVPSVLPTRPAWYIYRFQYLELPPEATAVLPFRYVEVDWNTEGLPRGPNDSFITPHFDFHFYTKDLEFMLREVDCASAGKTCDEQETGQAQMGRFLALPDECFLPSTYFPCTDSSIPQMGLHTLDGNFEYTVDNVNHNAVLLYGTFDKEIVFLEASVTLVPSLDAMDGAASGERVTWDLVQPDAYPFTWWPTLVSLQHLPEEGLFLFELHGFERHDVSTQCP